METIIKLFGKDNQWTDNTFSDFNRCVQAFVTSPCINIIQEGFPFKTYQIYQLRNIKKEWLLIIGSLSIRHIKRRYNVPLDIWIPSTFPTIAPIITISRSASNIIIKQDHSYVDKRGLIFLPYLKSWNGSHTLLDTLVAIINAFDGNLPIRSIQVQSSTTHPAKIKLSDIKHKNLIKSAINNIVNEISKAFINNTISLTKENEHTLDWIDVYADSEPIIFDMKITDPQNYHMSKAIALGLSIDNHLHYLRERYILNQFNDLSSYITSIRSLCRIQTYAFMYTTKIE